MATKDMIWVYLNLNKCPQSTYDKVILFINNEYSIKRYSVKTFVNDKTGKIGAINCKLPLNIALSLLTNYPTKLNKSLSISFK